jgi:stearoyl-CoA desaturase (delta-9 desaturase)
MKVDNLLDESGRARVAAALAKCESLSTVYELQNQLQAIWHKAGTSQDMLLQALQDWCNKAEATGIECLAEFAVRLRGYQLKPFNG